MSRGYIVPHKNCDHQENEFPMKDAGPTQLDIPRVYHTNTMNLS